MHVHKNLIDCLIGLVGNIPVWFRLIDWFDSDKAILSSFTSSSPSSSTRLHPAEKASSSATVAGLRSVMTQQFNKKSNGITDCPNLGHALSSYKAEQILNINTSTHVRKKLKNFNSQKRSNRGYF